MVCFYAAFVAYRKELITVLQALTSILWWFTLEGVCSFFLRRVIYNFSPESHIRRQVN